MQRTELRYEKIYHLIIIDKYFYQVTFDSLYEVTVYQLS